MRVLKYIVAMLLVVSMMLSGCKAEDKKSDKEDKEDTSTVEKVTQAPTKEHEESVSQTEELPTFSNLRNDDDDEDDEDDEEGYDGGYEVFDIGDVKFGVPYDYSSQLTIDKEWKTYGNGVNHLVTVYEKKSKEQSEKNETFVAGRLFTITYASDPDSLKSSMAAPTRTVFAKDNKYYYAWETPTDYQLYRSSGVDDDDTEEWEELKCVKDISVEHFVERNNLKPCSVSSSTNSSGGSNANSGGGSSSVNFCKVCKGTGSCVYCFGTGDCQNFNCNNGQITCKRDCGTCGGFGYTYSGTGMSFKKKTCSSCRGSKNCSKCSGLGYTLCPTCNGMDDCNICNGTSDCTTCDGTGQL